MACSCAIKVSSGVAGFCGSTGTVIDMINTIVEYTQNMIDLPGEIKDLREHCSLLRPILATVEHDNREAVAKAKDGLRTSIKEAVDYAKAIKAGTWRPGYHLQNLKDVNQKVHQYYYILLGAVELENAVASVAGVKNIAVKSFWLNVLLQAKKSDIEVKGLALLYALRGNNQLPSPFADCEGDIKTFFEPLDHNGDGKITALELEKAVHPDCTSDVWDVIRRRAFGRKFISDRCEIVTYVDTGLLKPSRLQSYHLNPNSSYSDLRRVLRHDTLIDKVMYHWVLTGAFSFQLRDARPRVPCRNGAPRPLTIRFANESVRSVREDKKNGELVCLVPLSHARLVEVQDHEEAKEHAPFTSYKWERCIDFAQDLWQPIEEQEELESRFFGGCNYFPQTASGNAAIPQHIYSFVTDRSMLATFPFECDRNSQPRVRRLIRRLPAWGWLDERETAKLGEMEGKKMEEKKKSEVEQATKAVRPNLYDLDTSLQIECAFNLFGGTLQKVQLEVGDFRNSDSQYVVRFAHENTGFAQVEVNGTFMHRVVRIGVDGTMLFARPRRNDGREESISDLMKQIVEDIESMGHRDKDQAAPLRDCCIMLRPILQAIEHDTSYAVQHVMSELKATLYSAAQAIDTIMDHLEKYDGKIIEGIASRLWRLISSLLVAMHMDNAEASFGAANNVAVKLFWLNMLQKARKGNSMEADHSTLLGGRELPSPFTNSERDTERFFEPLFCGAPHVTAKRLDKAIHPECIAADDVWVMIRRRALGRKWVKGCKIVLYIDSPPNELGTYTLDPNCSYSDIRRELMTDEEYDCDAYSWLHCGQFVFVLRNATEKAGQSQSNPPAVSLAMETTRLVRVDKSNGEIVCLRHDPSMGSVSLPAISPFISYVWQQWDPRYQKWQKTTAEEELEWFFFGGCDHFTSDESGMTYDFTNGSVSPYESAEQAMPIRRLPAWGWLDDTEAVKLKEIEKKKPKKKARDRALQALRPNFYNLDTSLQIEYAYNYGRKPVSVGNTGDSINLALPHLGFVHLDASGHIRHRVIRIGVGGGCEVRPPRSRSAAV